MELRTFPADAVILASGGLGLIFGRSTMSTNATGAAASRVYQRGAAFGNGEMIQFHPTGMLGDDKLRLMSEAARGEGGRVWVPKDPADRRRAVEIPEGERWYFLEEWYPAYGNTVPRDVASRALYKVIHDLKLGAHGEEKVFLDLTHIDAAYLEERLHSIMEIYRKFQGADPVKEPMEIYPAMHYSMGGLWVDFERDETSGGMKADSPRNQMTSIPGLYACGECDYAYHGANRLGANSLLSASFSGRVSGESAVAFCKGLTTSVEDQPSSMYDAELKRQTEINAELMSRDGGENAFALHRELGDLMTEKCHVVRDNAALDEAYAQVRDIEDRFTRITFGEGSAWANQTLPVARQISDMIVLAQAIVRSARERDECRGAHYKPEFELKIPEGKFPGDPEFEEYRAKWKENNETWMKTTMARYTPEGPEISFESVDQTVLPAEQPRDYR